MLSTLALVVQKLGTSKIRKYGTVQMCWCSRRKPHQVFLPTYCVIRTFTRGPLSLLIYIYHKILCNHHPWLSQRQTHLLKKRKKRKTPKLVPGNNFLYVSATNLKGYAFEYCEQQIELLEPEDTTSWQQLGQHKYPNVLVAHAFIFQWSTTHHLLSQMVCSALLTLLDCQAHSSFKRKSKRSSCDVTGLLSDNAFAFQVKNCIAACRAVNSRDNICNVTHPHLERMIWNVLGVLRLFKFNFLLNYTRDFTITSALVVLLWDTSVKFKQYYSIKFKQHVTWQQLNHPCMATYLGTKTLLAI